MAETLPLGATTSGGLRIPSGAHAIVLLVNGGRDRDYLIADELHRARFATLQVHGIRAEQPSATARWLTEQLAHEVDRIRERAGLAGMPVGIFGSGIGGGAALVAAAAQPESIRALVLRNARQHLAGSVLSEVRAATLFVVDADDDGSIAHNQDAMTRVKGIAELEILPESLVDHHETTAHVASLARRWFGRFLV